MSFNDESPYPAIPGEHCDALKMLLGINPEALHEAAFPESKEPAPPQSTPGEYDRDLYALMGYNPSND